MADQGTGIKTATKERLTKIEGKTEKGTSKIRGLREAPVIRSGEHNGAE